MDSIDTDAALGTSNVLMALLPITLILDLLLPGSPLVSAFALIPAHTFLRRPYVWNLFTHFAIETDVFLCILSMVCLGTWGRSVEAVWGSKGLLLTIFFINGIIGVHLMLLSALTYSETDPTFFEYHCGMIPTVGILSVSMAQLHPEDSVVPLLRELRMKHVPVFLGVFAVLYDLISGDTPPTPEQVSADDGRVFRGNCTVLALPAMWITWFYLRFISKTKDSSPSFALSQLFFPEGPRRVVASLSAIVFPVVRVCGLGADVLAAERQAEAPHHPPTIVFGGLHQEAGGVTKGAGDAPELKPIAGSTAEDADRRRAAAKAALAKRLAERAAGRSATPPPPSPRTPPPPTA